MGRENWKRITFSAQIQVSSKFVKFEGFQERFNRHVRNSGKRSRLEIQINLTFTGISDITDVSEISSTTNEKKDVGQRLGNSQQLKV